LLAGGVTVFDSALEVLSFFVVDSVLSVVDVFVSLLAQADRNKAAATHTRSFFMLRDL
jgi:hypothetical protein